jgi:hypothetical protein
MPIVPQSNGSEPPKVSASFVDLQTIRIRLLNALGCPARIISLETTIASLMVGRESAGYGLEALAECLGYDNRRSVSRLLNESAAWQRAANISLCTIMRGERNVRRIHKFISNKLNAAAFFVLSQLESNPDHNTPTLARIDAHTDAAIQTFLRLPLTAASKPTAAAIRLKTKKRNRTRSAGGGGGSVISWDIFRTLPTSLNGYGMRFFPINGKRPRIWKYRQAASKNPFVHGEWQRRYPGTDWAILTGIPLEGGGYLTVSDIDLHGEGEKFGNGFKTLALREKELGPLPETFTVATPRDGQHRYFRTTVPLPTWSGELGPGLDCKGTGSGLVVAPGCSGYTVVRDLPIADLPEVWQDALDIPPKTKRRIAEGERHNYLRRVSYSMACQGKRVEEIIAALYERLRFNCEPGRTITDRELLELAKSAKAKMDTADRRVDTIVA